jgi:2-(1,2-epoxy-1,2-dihydrophenyl)acetyl-CoA isomerase
VRVVVLTGAGSGRSRRAPISAVAGERNPIGPDVGLEDSIDTLQRQQDVSYLLHTMPKPTIAAINGAAAGASLSMALACDLRLAVDDAVLRTAFAGIGFSGDYGGSYFLTHLVGSGRARELMLLGERLSARDALAIGLVTRLFPRSEFRAAVAAVARQLAEGPPLSYRYMKRNLNLAESGAHLREILDLEAEAMMRTGRSEDFIRGTQLPREGEADVQRPLTRSEPATTPILRESASGRAKRAGGGGSTRLRRVEEGTESPSSSRTAADARKRPSAQSAICVTFSGPAARRTE